VRHVGGPVCLEIVLHHIARPSVVADLLITATQFVAINGLVDGEDFIERVVLERRRGVGARDIKIRVRGL